MASRELDGSQILQENNPRVVAHTGRKIVVSETVDDTIVAREDNTSYHS